jgi:hypothetical protein
MNVYISAAGTVDAVRPAALNQVLLAGILVRKHGFKVLICTPCYRFDAGHFTLPIQ